MSDDLERRLREAFDAKASQVTPEMLDVDREQQFAEEVSQAGGNRRRGFALAGLGAAATAAAVTVGVVVAGHQTSPRPTVAATSQQISSSAPTTSSSPTSKTTPTRPPVTRRTSEVAPPPPVTGAPQRRSTPAPPPPPAQTAPPPPSVTVPESGPGAPTQTPSEADGNYRLRGTLRQAAGVAYLPLPPDTPTYIEDETGRTTRLRTDDCAAILAYWNAQMPGQGWTKSSATKWIAPTGNAWAFTDQSSGACNIQISAAP